MPSGLPSARCPCDPFDSRRQRVEQLFGTAGTVGGKARVASRVHPFAPHPTAGMDLGGAHDIQHIGSGSMLLGPCVHVTLSCGRHGSTATRLKLSTFYRLACFFWPHGFFLGVTRRAVTTCCPVRKSSGTDISRRRRCPSSPRSRCSTCADPAQDITGRDADMASPGQRKRAAAVEQHPVRVFPFVFP